MKPERISVKQQRYYLSYSLVNLISNEREMMLLLINKC